MKAFERYAEYYDLIYKDKDYERECDFIYLKESGFAVLKIRPFLDVDGKVDENAWNIAVIAKAV